MSGPCLTPAFPQGLHGNVSLQNRGRFKFWIFKSKSSELDLNFQLSHPLLSGTSLDFSLDSFNSPLDNYRLFNALLGYVGWAMPVSPWDSQHIQNPRQYNLIGFSYFKAIPFSASVYLNECFCCCCWCFLTFSVFFSIKAKIPYKQCSGSLYFNPTWRRKRERENKLRFTSYTEPTCLLSSLPTSKEWHINQQNMRMFCTIDF